MSTSCFTVPFYAGVAYAMALGLRLPVCLSQVRVVLKQRNVGSWKQCQPQDSPGTLVFSAIAEFLVSSCHRQLLQVHIYCMHTLQCDKCTWSLGIIKLSWQLYRQTGRQAGRQTDRQADRQTDRQAGRQTVVAERLTKAMAKMVSMATTVSCLKPVESLFPNTLKYLLGIRPTW